MSADSFLVCVSFREYMWSASLVISAICWLGRYSRTWETGGLIMNYRQFNFILEVIQRIQ